MNADCVQPARAASCRDALALRHHVVMPHPRGIRAQHDPGLSISANIRKSGALSRVPLHYPAFSPCYATLEAWRPHPSKFWAAAHAPQHKLTPQNNKLGTWRGRPHTSVVRSQTALRVRCPWSTLVNGPFAAGSAKRGGGVCAASAPVSAALSPTRMWLSVL